MSVPAFNKSLKYLTFKAIPLRKLVSKLGPPVHSPLLESPLSNLIRTVVKVAPAVHKELAPLEHLLLHIVVAMSRREGKKGG